MDVLTIRLNHLSNNLLNSATLLVLHVKLFVLVTYPPWCNLGVNLCSTYTGRVCNVTGFGAFIDLVNVHDERGRIRGLAPISVNGATEIQSLQCGQRVDVKVINIDSLKRKYTFKLL